SGGTETELDLGTERLNLEYLLKTLVGYSASDLHLKPGRPPLFRIHGRLLPSKVKSLTEEEIRKMILSVLTKDQVNVLESRRQVDFSFSLPEIGRFRCNAFFQKETLTAAIRLIPLTIPEFDH